MKGSTSFSFGVVNLFEFIWFHLMQRLLYLEHDSWFSERDSVGSQQTVFA